MTQRLSSERRGEQGFTLIEVLAGLVLTSVILVSLNLAMTSINRGVEKARDVFGRQAAISTAVDIFGSDVARIARIRRGPAAYLFEGGPQRMVYPLSESRGVRTPALHLVRLSVREEAGRTELLRERAPLAPLSGLPREEEWRDPVVLLSGDYDIRFDYRAPAAGLRGWSGSWTAVGPMPGQVRLSITDRATGRLRVPVFVQSLRVDAEAECAAAPECGVAAAGGGP